MSSPSSALLSFAVAVLASSGLAQQPPKSAADFFGLDKIWDVHLEVADQDWESMYPRRGTRAGFRGSGSRFQYAPARLKLAGRDVGKVGLRFKGQSSWTYSAGTLKRSLKLDFDRYVKGQKFLGMKKLNLNGNSTDPTHLREAICYAGYRTSGVAASRTAFLRVFLTIPGRLTNEYLGLYLAVEQFDRRAMKRWFGSKKGLLLKPTTVLGSFGDSWNERYERAYDPKTEVRPEDGKQVVSLANLTRADAPTFARQLSHHMDVDQFLRYLAATVVLANMDSPLNLAHNYYLAVPERIGKVVWIPWDLNLSLGSWNRSGKDQDQLSILLPSRMAFAQKVLDAGTNEARYLEIVSELIQGPCSAQAMKAAIATARRTTRAAIAQESQRSEAVTNADRGERMPRDAARFHAQFTLEEFAEKREASVRAQLAGKSPGIPGGWSFNGEGIRRPDPRATRTDQRVRVAIAGDVVIAGLLAEGDVLAAAKKTFVRLDRDASGTLGEKELLACLGKAGQDEARHLVRRRGRQARRMLRDLNADEQPGVSLTEWQDAVRAWIPKWDRDGNGKLTRRELRSLPIAAQPAFGGFR